MELYTDASASKGFGGYYTGKWFSSAFIITKHLDRPFFTIPTVASLSHQNKMFLHFQSLPHKIAEITIGYNSKNAIGVIMRLPWEL
jgi:hypothetical protein